MWWHLAAGVVGLGMVGYTMQDYLLYYPTIENSRTQFLNPTRPLSPVFEEHFIETDDQVKLNIWLFRHPTPGRPTFLFFHGNAGSM